MGIHGTWPALALALSLAALPAAAQVKVGVVTSLDAGSSIAIQKKFAAAGGKTIDYDRLTLGGVVHLAAAVERHQPQPVLGQQRPELIFTAGEVVDHEAECLDAPKAQIAQVVQAGLQAVTAPGDRVASDTDVAHGLLPPPVPRPGVARAPAHPSAAARRVHRRHLRGGSPRRQAARRPSRMKAASAVA